MTIIRLSQPPDTRIPVSEDDWGDILTIGLNLISKDKNILVFAVYLGLNKVGIKDFPGYNIKSVIQYNSAEEMHAAWILD